jgi:hypothetical protein
MAPALGEMMIALNEKERRYVPYSPGPRYTFIPHSTAPINYCIFISVKI